MDEDYCTTITRIDEWINNRRVVTKGDASVCEICLRWVKRCPHTSSCVAIQTVYRGRLARRRVALKKIETARALFTMQRMARGFIGRCAAKRLSRDLTQSAITLQRIARGRKARLYVSRKAEIDLAATTSILALLTAHKTRANIQMVHNVQLASAVAIQRICRGKTCRRATRQLALEAKCAAIDIQRVWRGAISRKNTASAHESWNLLKGEIMCHLPHSALQASMALQKLPVSSTAKLEILNRLPIADSVKMDVKQELDNINRPAPAVSLDSMIKAGGRSALKSSTHSAGFIRPTDVRSRFDSYRRFGAAPAAE